MRGVDISTTVATDGWIDTNVIDDPAILERARHLALARNASARMRERRPMPYPTAKEAVRAVLGLDHPDWIKALKAHNLARLEAWKEEELARAVLGPTPSGMVEKARADAAISAAQAKRNRRNARRLHALDRQNY